jgi:hypothetical protein
MKAIGGTCAAILGHNHRLSKKCELTAGLSSGRNSMCPVPRLVVSKRWPSQLVASAAEDRLNISPTNRMPFRNDPWRFRAEEARTVADQMKLAEVQLIQEATDQNLEPVASWQTTTKRGPRKHL